MTTLENSYCRPQTEEEWAMFDTLPETREPFDGVCFCKTLRYCLSDLCQSVGEKEIPVEHFLDLLHDRIVPWRLEDMGAKQEKA